MIRSDNEVKQVLLHWLQRTKKWEQSKAQEENALRLFNKTKKNAEPPSRGAYKKKYSWDQLWRDLPDERFVAKAWISQTMEEAKNPPKFCKSWEHRFFVSNGEICEMEEPADGYGTYYIHPDAWDLAEKLQKVLKSGFDTSAYYDRLPKVNMTKGREFLVYEGADYTAIECRYRKNFLYKRVPARLTNGVQLYAKTHNRLFPSLEVVAEPAQKGNVHWHSFS